MYLELKTENKYFNDDFQSVNSYDKVFANLYLKSIAVFQLP